MRCVLEVIGPGDPLRLEQVEDRAGDRLVPAGRREDVVGREMPEGRGGEQVRAVRERLREHRGEIAIVDGELAGQVVIEGNLLLRVETDGLVLERALADVVLLGFVVHSHEPVRRTVQRLIRRGVVHLPVRADPGMVEVRLHAPVPEVESAHCCAAQVGVVVRAAGVIAFAAWAGGCAVGAARRVRQCAEVIVEGMVLLHEDENVLHFVHVSVGSGRRCGRDREQHDETADVFHSHGGLGVGGRSGYPKRAPPAWPTGGKPGHCDGGALTSEPCGF